MKVKEFKVLDSHDEDIWIDEDGKGCFITLRDTSKYDNYEVKGFYIGSGELVLVV